MHADKLMASNNMDEACPTCERDFTKYIQCLSFDGVDFRWTGSPEQLEEYFDEELKLSGIWSTPSGGVKLFRAQDYEVKCQRSKKLIIVKSNL